LRLEGSCIIAAPRERVWALLNDPEVIARHLPGCDSLKPLSEDRYEAELTVGVGPIKGSYKAQLSLLNKRPNEGYTLLVEGSGKPGHAKGEGRVTLSDEGGGTRLDYSGDLQIGGLIARVGQRILGTVSQQMAAKFFEGFGRDAESRA
jgi:carbon monoxide dehydrogenase subunit G